ncbi:MAG: hypothetical protein DRJ52_03815 [Thermoprotei archaeon]|nr:MAG: hypothetical protein DRJ52_03815 [Thermoprotei archaeon]RLE98483.1 MAG: hypothetical protein DRJ63_07615 [Thermoprotei archaeon]
MWKIEPKTFELKEETELFRNSKCYLKVKQGAKVLKISYRDRHVGYAFKGPLEYAVDTVIETSQGALGKSVKVSREDVVLVFMNPLPELKLSEAEADVDFIEEVLDICEELAEERKINLKALRSESKYFTAVFPRENYYEIIVAKENKLVYVSKNIVYITAPPDKNILVSKNNIVVSYKNKLLYFPRKGLKYPLKQVNIVLQQLNDFLNQLKYQIRIE